MKEAHGWYVDIAKSGHLYIRKTNAKSDVFGVLPLMQVQSKEEAERVVSLVGRLMYDGKYMWSWPLKDGDDFQEAAEKVGLEALWDAQKRLAYFLASGKMWDGEGDDSMVLSSEDTQKVVETYAFPVGTRKTLRSNEE